MSGSKSEDSIPSSVAQLQMRHSFGKRTSNSMVSAVSIRDRMAELDRYVAADSNPDPNNGAGNSEWADPLQPAMAVHSDSEAMHVDDNSSSNHASLSAGSNSNQGSLDMPNPQQQAAGIVEPWQLCPPVANNNHRCPHCSSAYSSKAGLRRHIDSKHPETVPGRPPGLQPQPKSAWQCEVCSRSFYHRSTLARHYAETHPEFVPIQQPFVLPPPGSMIPPGPFGLVPPPAPLFPSHTDAIAAAAAALQLGIFPHPPNFPTFPPGLLPSFLPPMPPIAQTTTTFSNLAEGSSNVPIVLSDESNSSPARKGKSDNGFAQQNPVIECLFCGRRFSNRNPALIFHQIVAHKLAANQFSGELSPPNFVNCPECLLPLDVTDANFPNHPCPGSKNRTDSMLCDRCGECCYNDDVYANHREQQHSLYDCPKCCAVVETLEEVAKHECPKQTGPIVITGQDRLFSCPLCPDRFNEKGILAEHVSSYHRTDFALFDVNGPFFRHAKKTPQKRQLSTGPATSSSSATLQSSPQSTSSPENVIPGVAKDGDLLTLVTGAEGETQNSPSQLPKRRPLANRASAADKWRNIDGFNCANCGATFLTSQSRAQHVRWRHPEVFAALTASKNAGIEQPAPQPTQPQSDPQPLPLPMDPPPPVEGVEGVDKRMMVVETPQPPPPQLPPPPLPLPVASPSRTKATETFDCPICGSSYISARSRAQHIRRSHPDIQLADPSVLGSSTDLRHDEDGILVHPVPLDETALLDSLKTGYKGTCELCGVVLANAQGRSQHLRYKHPEAWALLKKNGYVTSPSTSSHNTSGESPKGLQLSPNDLVLGDGSPELGGENGGHYTCIFCEKVFASKRGRGRHYYWIHQHRNKDYVDTAARSPTGPSTVSPSTLPGGEAPRWYACTRCPKRFLRRVGLSIHIAQAHRRSQQQAVGSVQSTSANETQPQKEKSSKKSSSPAANARCLECESCFATQGEVIRHLLDIHNISEPTDANWVWAVVHADDDDGEEIESELIEGDFVREPQPSIAEPTPVNLTCLTCQKVFPNELLFRGHMLLEHQVTFNGTNVSMSQSSSATSLPTSPVAPVPVVETIITHCGDCGKGFTSTRALHIHEHHTQHGPHRKEGPQPQQTGSNTIRCVNCNDQLITFASQSELQSHHYRKHKPFRCSKCGVLIEGHDNFRLHRCEMVSRKRPAGTSVEVIDLVSSSGPSSTNLDTPINADDYQAKERATSSISFTNSSNGSNNNETSVICGGCGRPFVSSRALHIHQRMASCQGGPQRDIVVISPESTDEIAEVFPCDLCSETFSRPQGLACHKRSKHNYVSMSPRSVASRTNKSNKSVSVTSLIQQTPPPAIPPPPPPRFQCKKCGICFESGYSFAIHASHVNSDCGCERAYQRRGYQSRVWGAIRHALLVKADISGIRREMIKNYCQRFKNEPKEPPEVTVETNNPRPRRSSTKIASPSRQPGKKTSPIVPTKRQTRSSNSMSSKKAPSTPKPPKQEGRKSKQLKLPQPQQPVEMVQQVETKVEVEPLAPPPAPGASRCSLCSQEFPTPVQLMVHLCRGNCALKLATQINLPSMALFPPPLQNANAGAEPASSTAAVPRKAPRMKRPTTFDSDNSGGDRPSPAFL